MLCMYGVQQTTILNDFPLGPHPLHKSYRKKVPTEGSCILFKIKNWIAYSMKTLSKISVAEQLCEMSRASK